MRHDIAGLFERGMLKCLNCNLHLFSGKEKKKERKKTLKKEKKEKTRARN